MKKQSTLFIVSIIFAGSLVAQPTLSFEKHALKAGVDNPMSYCSYADPGMGGANQVWDFSQLEFKKSFTGLLKSASLTEVGQEFSRANTDLNEFQSHFYFKVNEKGIEQYGYSSANGKAMTRYITPFQKMKYPFTFGDSYTGNFDGVSIYSGVEKGVIDGSYSVEADAFGKLLLPGKKEYDNTLRVVTTKRYTNTLKNLVQEVEVVTYRWYNAAHRYPLLVLTEYKVKSGENETTNYQAAYNNNAVNSLSPIDIASLRLFPNPASDHFALEYRGTSAGEIHLTVIDRAGKVVASLSREIVDSSVQLLDLSELVSSLQPASYILRINAGDELVTKSFAVVE